VKIINIEQVTEKIQVTHEKVKESRGSRRTVLKISKCCFVLGLVILSLIYLCDESSFLGDSIPTTAESVNFEIHPEKAEMFMSVAIGLIEKKKAQMLAYQTSDCPQVGLKAEDLICFKCL
jgi:hypothetical protein